MIMVMVMNANNNMVGRNLDEDDLSNHPDFIKLGKNCFYFSKSYLVSYFVSYTFKTFNLSNTGQLFLILVKFINLSTFENFLFCFMKVTVIRIRNFNPKSSWLLALGKERHSYFMAQSIFSASFIVKHYFGIFQEPKG